MPKKPAPYFPRAGSSKESKEEISDVKFVRELQPSFSKFAKPPAELVYKSEPFVPLKPFKPRLNEKRTVGSAQPRAKFSRAKSQIGDLYAALATTSSSVQSLEDVKSGEVEEMCDSSIDAGASNVSRDENREGCIRCWHPLCSIKSRHSGGIIEFKAPRKFFYSSIPIGDVYWPIFIEARH